MNEELFLVVLLHLFKLIKRLYTKKCVLKFICALKV